MTVMSHGTVEKAQQALDQCKFNDIRGLSVEQIDGCLLISGVVGSYYLKQQAQEAIRGLAGELAVINQVVVQERSTSRS